MMRTFFTKIFQLNWSMALFAVKKNITNHLLGYWGNLGKRGGITIVTFVAPRTLKLIYFLIKVTDQTVATNHGFTR